MGVESQNGNSEKGAGTKKIGRHFYWSASDSTEKSDISDAEIFSAYAALERSTAAIQEADRDWFLELRRMDFKTRENILSKTASRARLIELFDRYKDVPTGTFKKIELLDEETASAAVGSHKHLNPLIVKAARDLGATEIFVYENPIGNSRPVPLIVLEGKKYILKKVDEKYFSEYSKIQIAEHRPEGREVVMNDSHYGLFEFVGDRSMDYTDTEQLKQLCDLGIASAKRLTEFDPNPGNLVVVNERVFYIDVGLDYTNIDTMAEAVIGNIGACTHNIPEIFEKTYFLDTVLFIIQQFHDTFSPIQLQEGETVEGAIENQMAWFFHQWNNEAQKSFPRYSKEVLDAVREAIFKLF